MDKKDRRILYELSKNARMSSQQIARKVGLSKDAVAYRIRRLENGGIILKYQTVIDLKKLNYRTHVVFLEFRKFGERLEKEIISSLEKSPHVIWIATAGGRWDLIVDIVSKDSEQFSNNLQKMLNNIGEHLKSYEILENIKEYSYNHRYLLGKKEKTKEKKFEKHNLNDTDFKILEKLSENSRASFSKIAKELKLSHDKVNYRVKRLIKSGHIKQFSILINFSKLDLSYYYALLQFNNLNESNENNIVKFLENQKEVIFFAKDSGKYNYNLDILVNNTEELRGFMARLRENFGDLIELRETMPVFEQKKNNYFPKGLIKELNS